MPSQQTQSRAVKATSVNTSERSEYFLSERNVYFDVIGEEFVPQPIPEDPLDWQLLVSVSLGELTREDVEYIWERAKAKQMGRHFIHTVGEVNRQQLSKALQKFDFYDTEERNKKRISVFVATVDFMKELVKEAATLRSLYPKLATAPAPSATPQENRQVVYPCTTMELATYWRVDERSVKRYIAKMDKQNSVNDSAPKVKKKRPRRFVKGEVKELCAISGLPLPE